jgi:hypothetical protein
MSENWHKRQALSLAAQLPEDASDAIAVIRELQRLIDIWLYDEPATAPSRVVALHRDKE